MNPYKRRVSEIREKHGIQVTMSIIEGTFTRPQMYTIGGTVFEVGAFLEGYISGLAHDPKHQYPIISIWSDFNIYLSNQIEDGNGGWYGAFSGVRRLFASEEESFDYLLDKYYEFYNALPNEAKNSQ